MKYLVTGIFVLSICIFFPPAILLFIVLLFLPDNC